jgi:hypothetical protein
VPVQRSLFPDEYELKAEALAALRALEVPRAMACTNRARKGGAGLPDLDALEEALRWLAPRLQPGPPAQRLGAVLLAVAGEGLRGGLSRTAAAFVDEGAAHFAVHHAGDDQPFLDPEQQVPRALAQLLLGDAAGARRALFSALDQGHRERGDLWGWLGDACVLDHRADESGPCYARALLFAPERVDLWRIREPRLAACHAALRLQHAEAAARALLLAQAWIDGALAIPAANGWLENVELDRLLAAHGAGPDAPPPRRFRRFSLLLYRDRSRRGDIDLQSREEMAALAPELFPRFVQRCGLDEQAVPRRRP